jgi:hypothetical protein
MRNFIFYSGGDGGENGQHCSLRASRLFNCTNPTSSLCSIDRQLGGEAVSQGCLTSPTDSSGTGIATTRVGRAVANSPSPNSPSPNWPSPNWLSGENFPSRQPALCSNTHRQVSAQSEQGGLYRNVDDPTVGSSARHMQCINIRARVTFPVVQAHAPRLPFKPSAREPGFLAQARDPRK